VGLILIVEVIAKGAEVAAVPLKETLQTCAGDSRWRALSPPRPRKSPIDHLLERSECGARNFEGAKGDTEPDELVVVPFVGAERKGAGALKEFPALSWGEAL